MEAIVTALTTAITSFSSSAMGAIEDVLPVSLPIFGAIAVIGIGMKVFKRVSGAK